MLSLFHFAPGLTVNARAPAPRMEAKTVTPLPASVKPGVVTGDALVDLLQHAKDNGYAIPAVNVVSSCSISGCLEAAKKYGGPMMIQFSRGGGQFYAGKAADNDGDAACIAGAVAGALHVREVAKLYGVPVILHTDHCMRSWLPWFDGLIEANEDYFEANGEPLFSSHMLDLSEEPREEDGVDNSDVDSSKLYTQPEEVYEVYKALSAVEGGRFTIAAAFGNVHGVYSPGNVELTPQILHNCQAYIKEQESLDTDKPCSFVFHGGSGSSREDIRYAIEAGTIKMNIDTDTQWAFWDGIRSYEAEFRPYLQDQIGNPDGEEKPNKKYY